jgi:hypothetical protein
MTDFTLIDEWDTDAEAFVGDKAPETPEFRGRISQHTRASDLSRDERLMYHTLNTFGRS